MNESKKEILVVNISNIIPNRFQPRLNFDDNSLQELAQSITEHGIIQPLVVRRISDKFEIIAGERRFKAATIAGVTEVPVIVVDLNDSESAEVALIENIQRKDLSAIEEAKSYQKILDMGQLTQEALAKRMGKSQSAVANKIRLLNLPATIQNALMHNEISERHARSLLTLTTEKDQLMMLERIKNERLTVKKTDRAIAEMTNKPIIEEPEIESLEIDFDKPQTPIIQPIASLEQPTPAFGQFPELASFNSNLDIPNLPTESSVINEATQIINNDPLLKPEEVVVPQRIFEETPETNISMDYNKAVVALQETIQNLERQGAKLTSEEFNFENFIQINIKLDKK